MECNLPNLFGTTFLINLPQRRDRLKSATKQFSRVNWTFGNDGVQLFSAQPFADPAGFPSAAVRGCFDSHLKCLRNAHEARCESVLILEDDIALTGSLPRLTPAIKLLLKQQSWDFVYFGYYGVDDVPRADRNTNANDINLSIWTGEVLTTCFYAMNGRIFSRLISHLENIMAGRTENGCVDPMPVDGAYNIFRRSNPDVRCLLARPKLGWQRPSRSDITPHMMDRWSFFRPVGVALRGVKQFIGDRINGSLD